MIKEHRASMKLKLTRPLIFFDIESTGLSISSDRIVELCFIKVHPNGNEEAQTLRFNPLIPISPEASAVTGITNEDVKDCPTFKEKAAELAQIFSGCDIAGYNSNTFDVPLLVEEFLRAGVDFDINKAAAPLDFAGITAKNHFKNVLGDAFLRENGKIYLLHFSSP